MKRDRTGDAEKAQATPCNDKKKLNRRQQRALKRHRRVYCVLWHLLHRPLAVFFKIELDRAPELDKPCLVLSNHNTDVDFLFLGSSFKKHMYFVISEHAMQHGFASALLRYFISPISRLKGTTAASTAMSVIRTLRSGTNVCIFAEGNRSFNGETCDILPSTGKLARSGGAYLVTYRLEGAYMVSPRWSYTLRRGKMRGKIVNIYTPDQLRAMSDDEINDAINADLYENAYDRQSEWNAEYKGKRLAEGLEHILYQCPVCGGISTISTIGDQLKCTCGMNGSYDRFGILNGTPFRSVLEWDRWQKEEFPSLLNAVSNSNDILFSDSDISLIEVDGEHKAHTLAFGTLSMSKTAISIAGYDFPLEEIEGSGPAIYGRSNIVFNHGGKHYELKSKKRYCAVKYSRAYRLITEKAGITAAGI